MDSKGIQYILETARLGPVRPFTTEVKAICPDYFIKHDISEPSSGNSFTVKVDDFGPSIYHCFVCGKKGTLLSLVKELYYQDRLPITPGQLEEIEKTEHLDPTKYVLKKMQVVDRNMSKMKYVRNFINKRDEEQYVYTEGEWTRYSKEYHPYAKRRGITKEAWAKLDIRFDPFEKRIVQAIRRKDGKLVSVVGRAAEAGVEPRHLTYFSGPHLWIYREDQVRQDAVLFEGPFKAALAYSKGVENAISLIGAHFSEGQLDFLKSLGTITICLDSDAAGQTCTSELVRRLFGVPILYVIPPEKGVEIEELSIKEIEKKLNNKQMIMSSNYKEALKVIEQIKKWSI
jgi:hypothetical protein